MRINQLINFFYKLIRFERYVSTGDYFGETALIVHNGKRLAS